MKVQDLLSELKRCKKEYGDDFLDWDVYTEQISKSDKLAKTKGVQKDWGKVADSEGWEYFECVGFCAKFPKRRIFTVNVNF